jgi:hypothetical protein
MVVLQIYTIIHTLISLCVCRYCRVIVPMISLLPRLPSLVIHAAELIGASRRVFLTSSKAAAMSAVHSLKER